MFNTTPQWVYPKAKYDFDYANARFWGGSFWWGTGNSAANRAPSPMVDNDSSAAASTLFTRWRDGIVRTIPAQTALRRTDYGLWCEGGAGLAHNYALRSRDFTQAAWTLSTITAAKDQIGIDGVTNSASSLTATGVTDTAVQTLSFTNKLVTLSAWIKRITGTGTVGLSLDGVTFVDVSGQINSSTYTQCRLASATTTNPIVGVQLGTNGDKIAIDFFQVEDDDQATSPILTTTAVNQRGAEMPSLGTPAAAFNAGGAYLKELYYGTPVTFLVQYSGNFSTTLNHLISIGTDGASLPICNGAAGGGVINVSSQGGNFNSTDSDVSGLFTLNKVAVRFDGTGSAVCVNGGTLDKNTSVKFQPTVTALTHGGHLNNGSNILPTNGYEARWTAWREALSDGQMIEYTKLYSNT